MNKIVSRIKRLNDGSLEINGRLGYRQYYGYSKAAARKNYCNLYRKLYRDGMTVPLIGGVKN